MSSYDDGLNRCTKIFITWNKSFMFMGVIISSLVAGTFVFTKNMIELKETMNAKTITHEITIKRLDRLEKDIKELKNIQYTINAIAKKLNVDLTQ
jgi:hypothetical protein